MRKNQNSASTYQLLHCTCVLGLEHFYLAETVEYRVIQLVIAYKLWVSNSRILLCDKKYCKLLSSKQMLGECSISVVIKEQLIKGYIMTQNICCYDTNCANLAASPLFELVYLNSKLFNFDRCEDLENTHTWGAVIQSQPKRRHRQSELNLYSDLKFN